MAEPLGPPPVSATTSTEPSAATRLIRWPWISTRTTLPSDIATGPSGNFNPLASSRTSAIGSPPDALTSRRQLGTSSRSTIHAKVQRKTMDGIRQLDVLEERRDDGDACIVLRGELELSTAPQVREALARAEEFDPPHVILDMAEVT